MKIIIIHGQSHKGSTCMVARQLAQKVSKKTGEECELQEYFMPKDFNEPCRGCFTCYQNDLECCPHFKQLQPITDAMLAADLLIFASPVYVFHATGQMMNLLDHLGTWWIVHRPRKEMTKKQAVVISTAAGGGMKSTCKDMADSMEMWGVCKVYRLGLAVQAAKPEQIPERTKSKIDQKTDTLSEKIVANTGKSGMNIRAKMFFYLMRFIHMHFNPMEPDYSYWEKKGWHGKKRPWKDSGKEKV